MIGGELSFQSGGYDRTPIEDILPVSMQKAGQNYSNEEFKPVVEKKLQHHPILRLEKKESFNLKTWQSLPLLNGLNLGLIAKPSSHVLFGYKRKGSLIPVLAVQKTGKGRTAVLATDSS